MIYDGSISSTQIAGSGRRISSKNVLFGLKNFYVSLVEREIL